MFPVHALSTYGIVSCVILGFPVLVIMGAVTVAWLYDNVATEGMCWAEADVIVDGDGVWKNGEVLSTHGSDVSCAGEG